MDSHLWHAQISSCTTPAPPAYDGRQLVNGQVRDREEYAAQVRRHLRGRRLVSPKHDDVTAQLDRALKEVEAEPPGARTILSLSAPFAIGKSSLIKRWALDHYRTWVDDPASPELPEWEDRTGTRFDFVPIIYVTLMARSKARDVHGAILSFLGYPSRGSVTEITLRTTNALRDHRVRLIIVDDAHMLHTSSITGRETLDALKQINTELGELGGTLVLVGANLTDGPALTDPQVRGRLYEHHLTPYTVANPDEVAQWQRLLGNAEPLLRTYLPDLPCDSLPTLLAGTIYKRTQGFVGDVSALLAGAVFHALRDGRSQLESGDLADVRLSQRANDGERHLQAARGATPEPAAASTRTKQVS